MIRFYHDYETFSALDIGLYGAHNYIAHSSFRPLILTYAFDDAPVQTFIFDMDYPWSLPPEVLEALCSPDVHKVHHAPFDRLVSSMILHRNGEKPVPVSQCTDTSVLALEAGLPQSLDGASTVLKLPIRKNPIGKLAISKFCMPQRDGSIIYPDEEPELWDQFVEYAVDDTEVCRLLYQRLPPLSRSERELYELDAKINDRGIRMDLPAIKVFEQLGKDVITHLDGEIRLASGGKVAGVQSHAQIASFLELASVAEEPLEKAMPTLTGAKLKVAQLRQAGARTSALKLPKMLSTSSPIDHRSRGCLQFCGTKTKRWAGRAWQPHNIPRTSYKPDVVDKVVLDIMESNFDTFIRTYDDPLRTISMCLRGLIVPGVGKGLVLADYSQIEARLVAWYAGQWDALDIYESGGDIYKQMASDVYSIPVENVTDSQRYIGKVLVLSSGYGQGAGRLQSSLATQGVDITEEQAKFYTDKFRERWDRIPEFWWALKEAMFAAYEMKSGEEIEHVTLDREGNRRYTGLKFGKAGKSVYLEIATGLRCWFHGVRKIREPTPWDKTQMHTVIQALNYNRQGVGTYYTVSHSVVAENVCSLTARDLMSSGMKRVEAFGPDIIMTVHDEIVGEVELHLATEDYKDEIVRLMCIRPDWGRDIPLAVEANYAHRYAKL